ncbi:hypothetical protein [Shewanella sp. ULN5]|uniref:hypothetical protein n=1 Tax=Shewanella sp. ULN5 TaxID=2994678 RepID=UPI00273E78DB|nr:hypothetical protein [Shewanella sp. ULN5]
MKTKPSSIAVMLASSLLLSTATFSSIAGNGNGNSGQAYPGANGQPFQALQSQIDIINLTIEEQTRIFSEKFSQLEADNDSQDELIAAMQVALSIIDTRVTMNETDIDALEAADVLSARLISTLQAQLAALQASTSKEFRNLYAQSDALNSLISALRRDVDVNTSTISQYLDELRAVDFLLGRSCTSPRVVSGITTFGDPICVLPEGTNLQVYTINRRLSRFSFCDSSVFGACVDTDYYQNGSAFCNFGDVATGGGFSTGGFGDIGGNRYSLVSRPNDSRGWYAHSIQQGDSQPSGTVYVKCLKN